MDDSDPRVITDPVEILRIRRFYGRCRKPKWLMTLMFMTEVLWFMVAGAFLLSHLLLPRPLFAFGLMVSLLVGLYFAHELSKMIEINAVEDYKDD